MEAKMSDYEFTDKDGQIINHFYKKSKTSEKWNFYCKIENHWYPGNKEHKCPFCETVIPRSLVKPYYYWVKFLENVALEEFMQSTWDKQEREDPDGKNDPFRPPKKSVLVQCLHCDDVYQSSEMIHESRFAWGAKLWYCRNKDCSGAGLRCDIHKIRR